MIEASESSAIVTPTEWQRRILRIPESANLFLGGGRGGGKSTATAFIDVRSEAQYGARSKIWVFRPDTAKGAADYEDQIEAMYKAAFPGRVSRNRQEHLIRVRDGGSVEFSALDKDAYDKFQGRQCSKLIADEAGNFTSLKLLDKLRSNLRTPGVPLQMIISANPGGPAHAELARRYVTGRIPWRSFLAKDGETWITAPSTLQDNTFIDREKYIRTLRAAVGGDSALLEAWTTGNWGAISGAFFAAVMCDDLWFQDPGEEVWRSELKTSPHWWGSEIAIDWGWTAPSVALLGAVALRDGAKDPTGRSYVAGSKLVIDELATTTGDDPNEGAGWPPSMLAEAVLERCKRFGVHPQGCIDDARGLDGSTLIDQFKVLGLALRRPMKDRVSGWTQVKGMMAALLPPRPEGDDASDLEDDDRKLAKVFGDPDHPVVRLSTRCRYLAETLPALQRNPSRPEDIIASPKQPDHGADALRYFVTFRRPVVPMSHPAILLTGQG